MTLGRTVVGTSIAAGPQDPFGSAVPATRTQKSRACARSAPSASLSKTWLPPSGGNLGQVPHPRLSILGLALLAAACAASSEATRRTTDASLSGTELAVAARITASEISGHLRFLSDDLLEGRGPGSRGSELAMKYLAAQMEAAGLVGGATGGDGKPSFFQPVPLVQSPDSGE